MRGNYQAGKDSVYNTDYSPMHDIFYFEQEGQINIETDNVQLEEDNILDNQQFNHNNLSNQNIVSLSTNVDLVLPKASSAITIPAAQSWSNPGQYDEYSCDYDDQYDHLSTSPDYNYAFGYSHHRCDSSANYGNTL